MTTADDPADLVGLAASLDALFEGHVRGSRPVAGEAGPETGASEGDRASDARSELVIELNRAVGDAWVGDPGALERIRVAVRGLERTGHSEPVVDAVVRLASPTPDGEPPEPCLALARDLAVAGVADRLAARLGAVRDAERRAELTTVVGRLGTPVASALGEVLVRTEDRGARHALTSALAAMGEDGSEVLGTLARDHRWFVVRNAVLVLGETRAPWALPHLTRTLAHPDPRVRRETLIALARVGGNEAAKLVSGMISDPESKVREAAALAGGNLEARAAIPSLLRVIRDGDDPAVEAAALRALGRLGAGEWVGDLKRKAKGSFLYRPPVEVRIAAFRALAAVDTPEARGVVRSGLHDRDEAVRAVVQELLRGA